MGYTRTISFRSDEDIDRALHYMLEEMKNEIPLKGITESHVIKGCINFMYLRMTQEKEKK